MQSMKMKDLKAELDSLGVTWRGVCFEKDDLVRALEAARANPPPVPAPTPAPPPPEVYTSTGAPAAGDSRFGGFGSAMEQAEAEAAEVNAMSVDEIKAELDGFGVDYSSAGEDKAKLVSELLNARAFNRSMFDTGAFGGTQW